MNQQEKYHYWLDLAEYDLVTAEAMLQSGRYVHVAFMCQQALEKLVKGVYVLHLDDNVPRVHNISFLLNQVVAVLAVEVAPETYALLDQLSAYYIQGRYPTYKEKISQSITARTAADILQRSREAFQWIKSLKK